MATLFVPQTALFRDVHRRIAQHRGIEILCEQRPENIVLRPDLNHRQVFGRIESALAQVITAGEIVGAAESSDAQPFALQLKELIDARLRVNREEKPVDETGKNSDIFVTLQLQRDARVCATDDDVDFAGEQG